MKKRAGPPFAARTRSTAPIAATTIEKLQRRSGSDSRRHGSAANSEKTNAYRIVRLAQSQAIPRFELQAIESALQAANTVRQPIAISAGVAGRTPEYASPATIASATMKSAPAYHV